MFEIKMIEIFIGFSIGLIVGFLLGAFSVYLDFEGRIEKEKEYEKINSLVEWL